MLAFIAGAGPVTRFWHRKHEVLRGFYRFAMARGYAASSPLPKIIPQAPQFVPRIFSHEELRRLLDATACCESPRSKLQPYTVRMLILLAVCDKTYHILTRAPYADSIIPVPPLREIPLGKAQAFACKGAALRDPRETKGSRYRKTIAAS